jgi:glycosyltransferase involved in cell wall biosynthesis
MGFEVTVVCQSEQNRTYCSLAEGFDMPALEAMASGIPVFSSATRALAEVCADATLLVHLGDIDQISSELDQKLDLCQNLVLRGLGRARQYDCGNATDVVRNAYLG